MDIDAFSIVNPPPVKESEKSSLRLSFFFSVIDCSCSGIVHTMDRTANLGGEKSWRGTAPQLKHSSPNRVKTKKLQQRHLIHFHLHLSPSSPASSSSSSSSTSLSVTTLEIFPHLKNILPYLEKPFPASLLISREIFPYWREYFPYLSTVFACLENSSVCFFHCLLFSCGRG